MVYPFLEQTSSCKSMFLEQRSAHGVAHSNQSIKLEKPQIIAHITYCELESLVRACCASAETFTVPAEADRFYFFNPFSVEILQKTMGKILRSRYDAPREIFLFFYYPSDEYLAWLMTVDELTFVDEIDCRDLFEGEDQRERIMIFEMF